MSFGFGLRRFDLGCLLLDQPDEMIDDILVLQPMVRHAGDVDLVGVVAAAREADVGLARLTGAVHDTADHRHRHRRGDVRHPLLQGLDGADHVVLLPRAGRAGDDVDAAVTQVQRLQHLEADAHFFLGLCRERDADRVADARPQERPHADRGLNRAGARAAGLGDADMQGIVAGVRQLLVGGDREEDVGCLHADLEIMKVVVLQDARVVERTFDHRLGTGLAVLFQQILLERTRVDADAHGDAVVLGGLDDLAHALGAADIAGIDAQAGSTRVGRLDGALIVEVDVGHDRNLRGLHDGMQRLGRVLVRAGHADDVDAHFLAPLDLGDGRFGVGRQRVGHCLHGDRGAVAHRHGPNHDPPRFAAHDVAIGTDAHAANVAMGGRLIQPPKVPEDGGWISARR